MNRGLLFVPCLGAAPNVGRQHAITATIQTEGAAILHTGADTLRKAYATWLAVGRGVNQRVLQTLLGHTPGSKVTDQHYVQPLEEAKRKIVIGLAIQERSENKLDDSRGNTGATDQKADLAKK